jgi:ribonuclease BN (tRNA processing enzyme)
MTQITFLGVGGAMATGPADNHTALIVHEGAATILMDCGPTIMVQLERAGFTAGDITHIMVSHQHGDHTLGLPMLLLNRVLFWPERPLRVLAMPEVLEVLRHLTHLVYPDLHRHFERSILFLPLQEGPQPRELPGAPGITYATAPGKHSVPAWGLRVNVPSGRSLVYSSDTGEAPPIGRLAAGADLLIHDSFYLEPPTDGYDSHSTAAQVGELAAEAGVGMLVLAHRQYTGPDKEEAYRADAAKYFAGPILVPYPGDVVEL